jgi:hypothetical protein
MGPDSITVGDFNGTPTPQHTSDSNWSATTRNDRINQLYTDPHHTFLEPPIDPHNNKYQFTTSSNTYDNIIISNDLINHSSLQPADTWQIRKNPKPGIGNQYDHRTLNFRLTIQQDEPEPAQVKRLKFDTISHGQRKEIWDQTELSNQILQDTAHLTSAERVMYLQSYATEMCDKLIVRDKHNKNMIKKARQEFAKYSLANSRLLTLRKIAADKNKGIAHITPRMFKHIQVDKIIERKATKHKLTQSCLTNIDRHIKKQMKRWNKKPD